MQVRLHLRLVCVLAVLVDALDELVVIRSGRAVDRRLVDNHEVDSPQGQLG